MRGWAGRRRVGTGIGGQRAEGKVEGRAGVRGAGREGEVDHTHTRG